jgi:PET assembly of cytochrome c oxidase, mitochondrial
LATAHAASYACMSRRPQVVLGTVCLATVATIAFVHFDQKWGQERMHAGVLRDIEREKDKKAAARVAARGGASSNGQKP